MLTKEQQIGIFWDKITNIFQLSVKPTPRITLSQYAKDHFIIPAGEPEPGSYRVDRTPYMKDILDAITDPAVEEVVLMSSSQIGKTVAIILALFYYIDYDPCNILVVYPTTKDCEKFSKLKLDKYVQSCRSVRKLISPNSKEKGASTITTKVYPGGSMFIASAGIPAQLASLTVRVVLLDEIDRYDELSGSGSNAEGGPVGMAIQRSAVFGNRKIIMTSTPNTKGNSRIADEYNISTKGTYNLQCIHCEEYFPLIELLS